MLLITHFVLDENITQIIMSSEKYNELNLINLTHDGQEKTIIEWLKIKTKHSDENKKIILFDNSSKDNYGKLLDPIPSEESEQILKNFIKEYSTNYKNFFNINPEKNIDEYFSIIINKINFYKSDNMKGKTLYDTAFMAFHSTIDTQPIDTYIFAKTLFKTCMRDKINEFINDYKKTINGKHIKVNIYCSEEDKKTRFHSPECYSEINDKTEYNSSKIYNKDTDFLLKSNKIGENSVLGLHNGSLLDNLGNPIKKIYNSFKANYIKYNNNNIEIKSLQEKNEKNNIEIKSLQEENDKIISQIIPIYNTNKKRYDDLKHREIFKLDENMFKKEFKDLVLEYINENKSHEYIDMLEKISK